MPTVHVNLDARSYDIIVTTQAASQFVPFLRQCAPKLSRVMIISDGNVHFHATAIIDLLNDNQIPAELIPLEPGERTKSLEFVERLYHHFADQACDRKTLVIAVGGGVIGDLAGFIAATYNRGLAFLQIPTTLLAMVDSSVGGKVGINLPQGKNLVGSFHQPVGVWIDSAYLNSLPEREYLSGLAEVVKYGVILDEELFRYLEDHAQAIIQRKQEAVEHIVSRSCRLKADVVEKDEREETGLRMVLNYGHTFAHAFETVAGYGEWLHGEAVSAGMICASRLAEIRGLIDSTITERQIRLLKRFRLPTQASHQWDIDEMIAAMYRDKKTLHGKLRFILPTRLGEVRTLDDIPEEQVREVLNQR
jgi:3-dehydroquinate synthase